jgi:hypothetical protein
MQRNSGKLLGKARELGMVMTRTEQASGRPRQFKAQSRKRRRNPARCPHVKRNGQIFDHQVKAETAVELA